MKWDKVKSFIKGSAPLIAGLIPIPGAGAVVNMLASKLGTDPEPDKILEALKKDPNAILKLKSLEIENKTELEELKLKHGHLMTVEDTERIKSSHAIIQTELKSGDPYVRRARPTFMYIIAFTWGVQMLTVSGVIMFKSADDVVKIITAIVSLSGMWTIALGVVGVYIKMRSDDKNPAPKGLGIFGAIADRIKK